MRRRLGSGRVREALDLLISWAVISFCFAFTFDIRAIPLRFLASAATCGLGFLAHELSHRFVARRFGCAASYRMWAWGLGLALLTALVSRGSVIFAAPGAVYISYPIYWYGAERVFRRVDGLVALSGPLANIAIALLFYPLSLAGGLAGAVGSMGVRVNAWLAAFNLLPFPPLDGYKVVTYSVKVWLLLMASAIAVSMFLS